MGFWKDLRYAARTLRNTPGFTIVIVLSLALGIGANTAIFSIVNAYLLRPMPVDQPGRLVAIYLNSPKWGLDIAGFSYPDLLDYRKTDTGLAEIMGSSGIPLSMTDGEKPELIWGEIVTGNYFSGLGVHPVLGRGFLPDEDRAPGEKPVCVLNYNFWRRHFQGDLSIAGRTIRINGHPFTVVGVAPRGFIGTTLFKFIPDVWIPATMQQTVTPAYGNFLEGRGNRWMDMRGRLKSGVTLKQAEAALNVVARRLGSEFPQTNKDIQVHLLAGGARTHPALIARGLISTTTVIMFGVVALVLLIACGNVVNLMLARAATRAREMAIRVAVGASRTRLVRQLLTESVLLSLLGGAVGVALAFWFSDAMKGFYPSLDFQTVDMEYSSQPDPRVFIFCLLLSLGTALLFGLAPALRASKVDQAAAMKGEGPVATGGLRALTRGNALVTMQVALSCILLIGGGLFLRSMQFARNVSPGFDRTGIQMFSVDLDLQGYDEARGRLFQKNLVERLRVLPGVESASLAFPLPLDAYDEGATLRVEGYVPASENENHDAGLSRVGPHYFETMGTRLVAGRAIDEHDAESTHRVAVVNETLARRYWRTAQRALGRRLALSREGPWIQVVGVARNGKYQTFGEPALPYLFVPLTQNYFGRSEFLVRSKENPDTLMAAVRQQVKALDPSLPIYGVRTMPQFLNRTVSIYEMGASLVGTFAFTALLLAAIGIYGVLHFTVARRTREIGIRMALGAQKRDVLGLVLARSMRFVVAGLLLGIGGAAAAGGITGRLLAGVSGTDPATFLAVALLFGLVAFLASAIPARRASKVDPVEALRYQ